MNHDRHVGLTISADGKVAAVRTPPDYDTAARALGFRQFPDGRWFHPTPSASMNFASTWDTAEAIFDWWGRANGDRITQQLSKGGMNAGI